MIHACSKSSRLSSIVRRPFGPPFGRRARFEAARLVVLGLLLLGFALRVHDLTGTPPGISGDEMFYFKDARAVLRGEGKIYFETNTGHEPVFIYAEAIVVSLLGANAFALRYTTVVGGMASLAMCYVLGRRLFNWRVALVAMALFATVFWPLLITRVGLRAATFPLFSMLSTYTLWRALHERSGRWSLAAGLLIGLTLYTYVASRVFPAVVLLWLLALAISDRRLLAGSLLRVIAVLGLAALIALPLAIFAVHNPDAFNRRLYTMGGPYFDVQRGEFSSLVSNIGRVLGMFTVRGDAEDAFNVDARPVFDPIVGMLFYLGVGVGLSRLRRAAYSLLFIWLLVSLLPTVLAIGAPSFLRASGALFPILALPGIGLDWLVDRLQRALPGQRSRGRAHVRFSLVVLGSACVLGGVTASTLFGAWRTSPGVMKGYESDLYLAASYLDRHPPPPDASVFISARYASDHARSIFNLQSTQDGRVRWTSDFVWPSAAGEAWYVFSQESLPDDEVQAWLGVPPVQRDLNRKGEVVLEVYRLPARPADARPDVPVQARFDQLLDLIGVSYAQPAIRGQSTELALFWRVRSDLSFDPSDPPGYRLRLESRDRTWAEASGLLAFPPTEWAAGDVWVQRVTLQVPSDMPPQHVRPEIVLATRRRAWPVIQGDDERARTQLSLPALEISGRPTAAAPPANPISQFDDGLALLSASLSAESALGLPVFVGTTWQALIDVDRDYALHIALVKPDGSQVAVVSHTIWQDVYPTHLWRQGEQITSSDAIEVPVDVEPGLYRVRIRIAGTGDQPWGSAEWVDIGSVQVSGRAHVFEQPPVDVPLSVQFGEAAQLVGYRLDREDARPGGSIALTLIWRAMQPSQVALKVFTHLYNEENGIAAQHDGVPDNGSAPTTGWLPGEYIQDEHVIAIDPSVPPGDYRLGVGLYDEELLQRLTLQSDDGESDVFILTQVSLR